MVSLVAIAKRVIATTVARHDPGVLREPVTACPSDWWPTASVAATRGSNEGAMPLRPSGEISRSWIAVARGMRR